MSKYIEVFASLQEDIATIENMMRKQVDGYHPDLVAALNVLLSSGGKRVRPSITLLVGKMLGADKQKILTMATAIELLHTATLVHDDLIDESLLRRGIPTLNSKWSPGATVLTGDFLFASAAHIAANIESIEIVKRFSQTLITICNGEISQLLNKKCSIDREDYLTRIYAKTASLFETSACAAAVIGTSNQKCIEQIQTYGKEVGLAFQMMDDILDFTGAQATFGKPIGNDLLHGLITLPTICFVENYPNDPLSIKLTSEECFDSVEVNQLIEKIRASSAISQAITETKAHVDLAIVALSKLPLHPARESLINIAEFIVDRTF